MSKCKLDNHEVEASSLLATTEDIHKRLTQLHSSSSIIASHMYELQHENSSQSNLDTYPLQKRRKSRAVKVTNNERLEDYFDLSLLSAIRAKMNSSMKKQDEAIVDLKDDEDDSFGDGEENHVNGVDPFQRFESTALMRFKK
ncbi:hypothetical protein RND71_003957 [Anisodus tanguticus]|uniref:Uncharacterized protein n=1 Tax=Anisodus tanguticus TaxID=243964 RepID=A0AAE1SZR0_9SOLA|nr:hypothetical protein RND71_003957 [Anisodus tanguticus]